MIGRTNRFHGRSSLQRHYGRSKSVRSSVLALRSAFSNRAAYRAAVVVSRKVSKSAVVRNCIRRRIYEDVRILSSQFTGPCDLVFFAYDEHVAVMPADELLAELTKLCQKAQVIAVKSTDHAIVESKE